MARCRPATSSSSSSPRVAALLAGARALVLRATLAAAQPAPPARESAGPVTLEPIAIGVLGPAPRTAAAAPVPPPWAQYAAALYLLQRVPYRGGPIPPGTVVERGPIAGWMIAGGTTFGVMYALSVIIAALPSSSSMPAGWWAIPVVGPLIYLALSTSGSVSNTVGTLLSPIVQAGGLAMFFGGLFARRALVVPAPLAARTSAARASRWHFTLAAAASDAPLGLGLNATFE